MENLNGLDWTGIVAAVLFLGEIVVQATPTKKDDNIFSVIRRVITFFMKSRKRGGGFH
jgi:hypothetical protein